MENISLNITKMNKLYSIGAYTSILFNVILTIYICYLIIANNLNEIIRTNSFELYIIWILAGISIFGLVLVLITTIYEYYIEGDLEDD